MRFSAWSKTTDRGAVDDVGGDLLAPVGGQAVHEDGGRAASAISASLTWYGAKRLGACGPSLGVVAHREPDVRVDGVGAGDRLDRVVGGERPSASDSAASRSRGGHDVGVGFVARRGGDGAVDAGERARLHEAVGDVVAVAQVGDPEAGRAPPKCCAERQEVGEGLAGVVAVGEGVDHRDRCRGREAPDVVVGEGADDEGPGVAADDPAVSSIVSPRPSWSSSGRTTSGTPPSWLMAEPNDSRVRVDGLAK